MKINFLFRSYNLKFFYDPSSRTSPMYPITPTPHNSWFRGYQSNQLYLNQSYLNQLYFSSNPTVNKSWRNYKIKKL